MQTCDHWRECKAIRLGEAVRHHFTRAVAQEKGRLACFQFNVAKGASEHLQPVPAAAEHAITDADIVDIATLRQFRRQSADLPEHIRKATKARKAYYNAVPHDLRCDLRGFGHENNFS